MWILVVGVALWWGAHLFKRIAPEKRASMGMKGRGPVAGALLLSVILMIIGYLRAKHSGLWEVWWLPTPATKGINNLLVLFAFYLFAAAGMKTWIARRFRHPQLTGFSLWAVAHLLVNGDMPSFVLFGGLLLWAVVEIVVINAAEPDWKPTDQPAVLRKEIICVVAALVVFGVVGMIHTALGYNPFGA